MKKALLVAVFALFSIPVFAQSLREDWDNMMSSSLYYRMAPNKQLDCCNEGVKSKTFAYSFGIPESSYYHDDFSINRYLEEQLDSGLVAFETERMFNQFSAKYSKKKISKFNKSCYYTYIVYDIHEDLVTYVTYVQARAYIIFSFQQ